MTSSWASTTGRLAALLTGRVVWEDPDTGETETETMGWRDRWAIFGLHSYNWRWVRRFGERDCGCTIHPLTRRKLLTRMDCPEHGVTWAEIKGCDDDCDGYADAGPPIGSYRKRCCCDTGFDPKDNHA